MIQRIAILERKREWKLVTPFGTNAIQSKAKIVQKHLKH
jgi:hypothetical protein